QVGPDHLAATVDVVVHGQPTLADLDAGTLGGIVGVGLQADQLELVGLAGLLGAGLVIADLAADEALALLDDAAHLLLERLERLGGEGLGDVEVVVEAIGDGRADAELGLGIDLLHGLGQDVGGTVAQDRQPVLAGDVDALDMLSVLEPLAEITQLPVDAQGDDLAAALEQLGARGALLDPLLCLVAGDGDLGHGMLLLVGSSLPTMPARFRRGGWCPRPRRARNALGSGRSGAQASPDRAGPGALHLLVGSSLPTMPARFRRGRWYPCPGRARNALGSGCSGDQKSPDPEGIGALHWWWAILGSNQ